MGTGEKIRKLREGKGLSQYQLSKVCGVTQAGICYIERDERNPSLRVAKKIAKALDVDIREII